MTQEILDYIEHVNRLSASALTVCVCISAGYALRFIKKFPNDGIPLAVILTGGIMMMLLADARVETISIRLWIARSISVGLVLGTLSWFLHKLIISKLEDYLAVKFSAVNKILNPDEKNTSS